VRSSPTPLTITATGVDGLAATQAFNLEVLGLGTPVFSSANQAIFTSGESNTFTVAAGPFVSNITVPAGSLPQGITLTDNHNGTATLSTPFAFNPSTGKPVQYSTTQTFTLYVLP
jgi:hypothetical protein